MVAEECAPALLFSIIFFPYIEANGKRFKIYTQNQSLETGFWCIWRVSPCAG